MIVSLQQMLRTLCITFVLARLFQVTRSLDHEKSFLLQDGASNVFAIALYHESLLLTSANDIVQKNTETGAVERTFRAHTGEIRSMLVTSNSLLISCGYDDFIILWNLETGSIVKRIWLRSSGTFVQNIFFGVNGIFTGGQDFKVRQIDVETGRLIRTTGMIA
jgi:WD40 repeat protein